MSYSVYLFGGNSQEIAHAMHEEGLVERVLERFRNKRQPSERDVAIVRSILVSGLKGAWPDDGTVDSFEAFCWLMDVISEPIVVECLRDFRSVEYFESMELWSYFLEHEPPFPVPVTSEPIPRVGFLPYHAMSGLLERERGRADQIAEVCRGCREEVLEVIESLSEDRLDLVAVLSVW